MELNHVIEDNLEIEDIKLVDLLDVSELQLAETAAAKMARMAMLITDENGTPITEGSLFSRFCTDFCRTSEEGRKRCEACDMMGGLSALDTKKPVFYYCHANLVDFAAPIMLGDKVIGNFIGGQVLSEPPNLDKMRVIASEIGVDEDEFVEAAKEVSIVPQQAIARCTDFIYEYSQIISAMAYRSYVAKKESAQALRAATAKTDFLANMSHEIRTPMNAIIGMSQIALREEMSERARDYLNQVSNSANMLLTIINDILDYSKLDAGKMSIVPTNYYPIALLKDVSSIISNRVMSKDIEFVGDIDPACPSELYGDDVRLKQILVNLANNAVKFTNHGMVKLDINFKYIDDNMILLKGSIEDTGIGIKKEHLSRLFNSFEQVDSKRNRKVEGTGLGLAIVKELTEAMGGKITVESEYEKGSKFSFEIPQRVVNSERIVKLLEDCPTVIGVINSPYLKQQIEKDMSALGIQYIQSDEASAYKTISETDVDFVITEDIVCERHLEQIENLKHIKFITIVDETSSNIKGADNIIYIKKPFSIIEIASAILNKKIANVVTETVEQELNFTAPDANILIVDDNEVNLSVAEGLLEPINMNIDTATSGLMALKMIKKKQYDIIFMDHMMPEMDGVETTIAIRKDYPSYKETPIVALTANALASSREELLSSGMNDFVAKPIVLSAILGVMKKHLPKEMIIGNGAESEISDEVATLNQSKSDIKYNSSLAGLSFLDTRYALELLKTEKLYMKVLKDYYQMIDKKHEKIKACIENDDIKLYTVEVHALKSSSKQIGALELSELAMELEAAGNNGDMDIINEKTPLLLDEYLELKKKLEGYYKDDITVDEKENAYAVNSVDTTKKVELSVELINTILDKIEAALDELDLDLATEVADEFINYDLSDKEHLKLDNLKEMLENMDIDGCMELIADWRM